MNVGPYVFTGTEELDDISEFILDSAHIANSTITTNPDLLDTLRL